MSAPAAAVPPEGRRAAIRAKSADDWIADHASGTLRKAKALDFSWRSLYLHERTAYEWGWEFVCVPASRVTAGPALIEGDTPALTEACWHAERYLAIHPFADDAIRVAYVTYTAAYGPPVEGVAIIVGETTAPWVPDGHAIFAILAPFDRAQGIYLPARNPF